MLYIYKLKVELKGSKKKLSNSIKVRHLWYFIDSDFN